MKPVLVTYHYKFSIEFVTRIVLTGKLCPAIHKAVKTMRRNEKAELSVRFSCKFSLNQHVFIQDHIPTLIKIDL